MLSRASLAMLALLTPVVGACSILNAPDDVQPGGGGSAADGGAGPTSSSSSSATTSDGGAGPSSTSAGGGGSTPSCDTPADCEPAECEGATCDDGVCNVTPKDAGVACGPSGDGACELPGRCDGGGACEVPNTEGASCDTCEGSPSTCVCRATACAVCESFADVNTFVDDNLVGWELTGGWGLYNRFPRDRQQADEVPIGKRVLGTDGNRAHPYPGGADAAVGGALEQSSAKTPTIELPVTLTFRSWHEDEGGAGTGRDNKRIVARSGELEVPLVDCGEGIASDLAFCQPFPLSGQREAGDWDTISIELPPNIATLDGSLEFSYDSVDESGGRERGWFIDLLGAAGRCGCSDDGDCGYLDGPCSIGICDTPRSACTVTPRAGTTGDSCGASEASACSTADKCDAFGYCDAKDRVDGTACSDCEGGDCQACGDGVCAPCNAATKTFEEPLPTLGWVVGTGWGVRTSTPASGPNFIVNFGTNVFGTLGEASATAETIETAIPAELTFRSWHVDGGGTDGEGNKTIAIVTGAGDEVVILDCAGGVNDDAAPCVADLGPRAAANFDDVTLSTGDAAGEVATIVFGYETDAAPAFSQGWFIDELNAVRCP